MSGSLGAWEKFLGNSQDCVDLLLHRMQKDFESLAIKMRKPWSQQNLDSFRTIAFVYVSKQGLRGEVKTSTSQFITPELAKEQLQRICACFLSCLTVFKESVPTSYFEGVREEIVSTLLVW